MGKRFPFAMPEAELSISMTTHGDSDDNGGRIVTVITVLSGDIRIDGNGCNLSPRIFGEKELSFRGDYGRPKATQTGRARESASLAACARLLHLHSVRGRS